jgi:NAD(P)-dependent dehydrogenase (short-subunit alcohol dehydrogenase family)
VLITGSTTGLGEAAARQLLDDGHEVVLHARTDERAQAVADLAARAAAVVIGDLSDTKDTRAVAEQVERVGGIDATIHNAALYAGSTRADILAVNVIAPYLLTVLTERPARLVFLSSSMHRSGNPSGQAFDWTGHGRRGVQAYCDSKLYLTALAMAFARRWPDLQVNVVDPGWVPTRMGGPNAPDDLELGYRTQTWLAVSDEPGARVSGAYWHHRQQQPPAVAAIDHGFQDALLDDLARITGVTL